ncbi:phytoene desaturase family protein [Sphingobacterium spiritivorum]|uniref:phytoene desaturase family protein n=1 Tax=Sphingobacterium spiritivorum TaxID=258 RepID=UPI003DA4C1EB
MNVSVIGSGISGLAAACYLTKQGHKVSVFEKNGTPGGRARQFREQGFVFDMGPSWYWMPDIIVSFFQDFGHEVSDYYELQRLDPSYTIIFDEMELPVPADMTELENLFESIEPGSKQKLRQFMQNAAVKYEMGLKKYATFPSLSVMEYVQPDIFKALMRLDLLSNMDTHVNKYFKNPYLQKLMKFPVLFLGAMADKIPAMYSLMNYADASLGTWYPKGGMYNIIEAQYKLAKELGVSFYFDHDINELHVEERHVKGLKVNNKIIHSDFVIASGDYHHMEQLLPAHLRNYNEAYWSKRQMAPTCLIFYLGINKRLALSHHTLFFDSDFNAHARSLYEKEEWPKEPMFYVCAPSVTDSSVAPEGHENLFVLIPLASGLEEGIDEMSAFYFENVIKRMETRLHTDIMPHICYQKKYTIKDFKDDYYAFKGNAYGLANTLSQTAFGKPSLKNRKIDNMLYCGQLSVPGPGIPPALLSGKIVADQVAQYFGKTSSPQTL